MVDPKLEEVLCAAIDDVEKRIVAMGDIEDRRGFEFPLDMYALSNQLVSLLTYAERAGVLNDKNKTRLETYKPLLIGLRESLMKDLHVWNPAKPEGRIY